MKKCIFALATAFAFLPRLANAAGEFPIYTPALSCTVFGKIANQVCLEKQGETYQLAQVLWREARDDARTACKYEADQAAGNTSYQILSRCLSFHNGRQRLLIWTIGPRWIPDEK